MTRVSRRMRKGRFSAGICILCTLVPIITVRFAHVYVELREVDPLAGHKPKGNYPGPELLAFILDCE